jgi:hypothetical protein
MNKSKPRLAGSGPSGISATTELNYEGPEENEDGNRWHLATGDLNSFALSVPFTVI